MAEYDDLGAQLDALMQESSLLKAPGVFQEKHNPGSREAYQIQREALAQRIADLKRKYEASIGNPGAVTGRAAGPTGITMNSPPVPALRTMPSPSVATPSPAELADPTSGIGALPRPPVKQVPQHTPGGVFSNYPTSVVSPPSLADEAMGPGGRYGGQSDVDAELGGQPKPAVAAPVPAAPAAPQKGLREQFMERLAGMNKGGTTGMTQEQKGRALMEAGLAIMAASKPGVSALSAIGQGGMQGTAVAREMEKINRERADKLKAEERGNLRTEFELAGRDEDRADRRTERTERHTVERERIAREGKRDENTQAYQMRHLDVLEKQFKAGQKKPVEDAATGTYTILDLAGGPAIKTDVKFDRKDSRPDVIKVLDALQKNPSLMETSKQYSGEKGGITNKDIFNKAFETTVAQVKEGNVTPIDQLLQQNTNLARRAAGATNGPESASKGAISRKSKVYQDRLKTRAGGDAKKFDAELQAAGFTVTE